MNPDLLERDFTYFRSLYAPPSSHILGFVIREVERISCPESFLFDEFPDTATLNRMSEKILSDVRDDLDTPQPESPFSPSADSYDLVENRTQTGGRTQPGDVQASEFPSDSPWLPLLVKALLFDEIILLRQRRASLF